ncbi:MAG TPA: hypothetical protein GXX29_02920 [Firmicutes bacterium]|nr:hypothetical protein [Bacillota bacterium]
MLAMQDYEQPFHSAREVIFLHNSRGAKGLPEIIGEAQYSVPLADLMVFPVKAGLTGGTVNLIITRCGKTLGEFTSP